MTSKEISMLIGVLRKENETNTEEERAFNLEWIGLLGEATVIALQKRDDSEKQLTIRDKKRAKK